MTKKTKGVSKANTGTDRAQAIAKAAAGIKAADTQLLATTALASSTSRFDLAKRVRAFIGNTAVTSPLYAARHAAARRSVGIGYLAGRFRRDGDNRTDDELLIYATEVYGCAKPDAEKIDDKNGQRRCTAPEWAARGAMRTYLSGLFGEAEIVAPSASGGGDNGADARAKAKAEAVKRAKSDPQAVIAKVTNEPLAAAIKAAVNKARGDARSDAKFAPSLESVAAFVQSVERGIVAYLQAADKINSKNKGALPPQVTSALTDCRKALASIPAN